MYMDHHAVPKQVTTFEFKLIGFFTVKEFVYLLLFSGFAVVTYFIIPVPILRHIAAFLVALLGVALVFFKYNERPLDVWIKNLYFSLIHPSQYFFHKDNPAPAFLQGVVYGSDPDIAETHIDAHQKLTNYMNQTSQSPKATVTAQATTQAPQNSADSPDEVAKKQEITTMIHTNETQPSQATQQTQPTPDASTPVLNTEKQDTPFISGIVKNSKDEALPNIMIYINSEAGEVVRILKTNHNGVFATFHALPTGTFIISPKDLGGTFFFDTMTIHVDGPQSQPLQIFSKELL